jgi:NADH-quinone oxidoreductase subunit K
MYTTIPLEFYLFLSGTLFCIGLLGVLLRRNLIVIFMSIELMLNSVNLSLIAFAQSWGNAEGQIVVLFVMAVAAVEAALGLAIVIAFFRLKKTLDVNEVNLLKW